MRKGQYLFTPERFWEKVDKSGGPDACWPWMGDRNAYGYGEHMMNGKRHKKAHRTAYELAVGSIPEGYLVLHHCDNPPCCNPNPKHLFVGTHKDNSQDMAKKKRHGSRTHPEKVARGDQNGSRLHPEKRTRGDDHWTRKHPEKLARGDRNGTHTHPEKVARGERQAFHLHPESSPEGEKNNHAKLTTEQVQEIRALYASGNILQKDIAKMYGVLQSAISAIVTRRTWKHI